MPSSTQFVQADGRIAAQSYRPCHLFGDGDLYGKGVRYSFYIQYAAATIALWFNLNDDITSVRFGLTVIAIALFINLCINSTAGSVVILDWVIVLHLIVFIPAYAVWRPLYHYYIRRRAKKYKRSLARKKAEGQVLGLREAEALTESYKAVASAIFTKQILGHYGSEYEQASIQYHIAVANFLQNASLGDQLSADISLFQAGQLREDMNTIETLQSFYTDALERIIAQYEQSDERSKYLAAEAAQCATDLAYFKQQEHAINQMGKVHKSLWRHEKISLAVTILIWVAYMCATPWIFFKASNIGRKQGCDIKLRTLYAPISIDNRAYLIWLRFVACFTVATFVPLAICAAGYTFVKGIEFRFQLQCWKRDKPLKNKMKKLSNDNVIQERTTPEPTKEEVEKWSAQVSEDVEDIRKFIYRGLAVPSCIFGLVNTVVLVELTIKTNDVDLSKSSISSTSQLLTLLIAIFTATSVVFHSFVEKWTRKKTSEEKKKSFIDQAVQRWSKLRKGTKKDQEEEGDKTKDEEADKRKLPEVKAEEGNAGIQDGARYQ